MRRRRQVRLHRNQQHNCTAHRLQRPRCWVDMASTHKWNHLQAYSQYHTHSQKHRCCFCQPQCGCSADIDGIQCREPTHRRTCWCHTSTHASRDRCTHKYDPRHPRHCHSHPPPLHRDCTQCRCAWRSSEPLDCHGHTQAVHYHDNHRAMTHS